VFAIKVCFAVVAILLGSVGCRLSLIASRAGASIRGGPLGDLSGGLILAAWITNIVWAFHAWRWYIAAALGIVAAVGSGFIVSRRSARLWAELRPVVAAATSAAAAVLWLA